MIQNRRRLFVMATLLALGAGCGKKDEQAPSIKPDEKGKEVQPEPSPTVAPTASAVVPVRAEIPPVKPRSSGKTFPMRVFAGKLEEKHVSDREAYRIFAVGDKMVVAPKLRVLKDGQIQEQKGLEEWEISGDTPTGVTDTASSEHYYGIEIFSVMGRYPDDIWMEAEAMFGPFNPRAPTSQIARYRYQRIYGRFGRVKQYPIAAVPWSKWRTLAYYGDGTFKLARPEKGKPSPLPVQAAGKSCPRRVDVLALSALSTGEVAVVGADCDGENRLALEVWPGDTAEALAQSKIVELPSPAGLPINAWLFSSKRVTYAAANYQNRAWLAEIRDGAAREIELPFPTLSEVHLAPDGALFFYGGNSIYRLDREGDAFSLTRAVLPPGAKVEKTTGLFAASKDEVYLALRLPEGGNAILTSKPEEPIAADDAGDAGSDAESDAAIEAGADVVVAADIAGASSDAKAAEWLGKFPALGSECKTPLVLLHAVATSIGKDFDFKDARAALKDMPGRSAGLALVDFEHEGRRFLAVLPKDAAEADAIVAYWKKKFPTGGPRAACHEPPKEARRIVIE